MSVDYVVPRVRVVDDFGNTLFQPEDKLDTFLADVVTNAEFFMLDCTAIHAVSVQITALVASGVVTFEVSNDGSTWAAAPTASANALGMTYFTPTTRYLKARSSGVAGQINLAVATLKRS